MSGTEGSQPGGSKEQEVSKDVTVIGYAEDDHQNDSLRKFARVLTGLPTDKSELVESTYYEFHAELGGVWEYKSSYVRENYFNEDKADEMAEKLEEATGGDVKLVKKTNTNEEFESSLSKAGKSIVRELTEGLPDEINGAERNETFLARWQNDVGQKKANMNKGQFEEMRILSKEEKREDDNLFESLTERPCVRINITLNGEDEEELDDLTERMVTPVHKALAKIEGIGKVRYMDCTVTTKREGDCYNI